MLLSSKQNREESGQLKMLRDIVYGFICSPHLDP